MSQLTFYATPITVPNIFKNHNTTNLTYELILRQLFSVVNILTLYFVVSSSKWSVSPNWSFIHEFNLISSDENSKMHLFFIVGSMCNLCYILHFKVYMHQNLDNFLLANTKKH